MTDGARKLASPMRDPALDWLRGIFVLFVLVLHAEMISGVGRESVVGYFNMAIGPILMPTFFVLSGFLGRTALRRAWMEFLTGPILRLLWPYFVWGFVYVLAVSLVEHKVDLNWQAFALLITRPAMLGPIWYLAYLAGFFLIARCLRAIPPWAILLILAPMTMVVSYWGLPFKDVLIHATAFFAGLALSNRSVVWDWLSRSVPGRAALPLTICALGVSPYFFDDGLRDNGLFITWILVASAVIIAGANCLYNSFGSPFLIKMGIESLAFYLTHWPIMLMVSRVNNELHLMNSEITFWVALLFSVAIGVGTVWVIRRVPLILGLFEAPRLTRLKNHDPDAATRVERSRLST